MSADADELFPARDEATFVAAARALMIADENAALVTVDDDGQPRVRSVRVFLEDPETDDPVQRLTGWIMTRLSTRKVSQVRRQPLVTLYFDDDAQVSYLSIMGSATVHTDPNHERARQIYDDGYAAFFWPQFPDDFVMIEVRPQWVEFMGPTVPNHPEHWRPQSMDFRRNANR